MATLEKGTSKANIHSDGVDSAAVRGAVTDLDQAAVTHRQGGETVYETVRDNNRWDKSILREPTLVRVKDTYPEDFSSMEASGRTVFQRSIAMQLEEINWAQKENGAYFDHDNPVYQKIQAILTAVIKEKGLNAEQYDFEVLHAPTPNAFIYRHPEIERPLVVCTSALIAGLDRYLGGVREGHMRMILGHEIGHDIEGHYSAVVVPREPEYADPVKVELTISSESALAIPSGIVFSRSQEYLADEHGVRSVISAGCPVSEVLEVLDYLSSLSPSSGKEGRERLRSLEANTKISTILELAFASHPPLLSRVEHAKGFIKKCELEEFSRTANTTVKESSPSAILFSESQRDALDSTPHQLLVEKFDKMLRGTPAKPGLSIGHVYDVLEISKSEDLLSGGPETVEELRHAILLVPAVVRIDRKSVV